jgi:hypothetical protein
MRVQEERWMDNRVLKRQRLLRGEQSGMDIAADPMSKGEVRARMSPAYGVLENVAEPDGLPKLCLGLDRFAPQRTRDRAQRQRANTRVVISVAECELVMDLGAIDGQSLFGGRDGIVDPTME